MRAAQLHGRPRFPGTRKRDKSKMPTDADNKRQAARDVIDILEDISKILNTNLTRTELSLCVSLIENGVNPDALAAVVKDLRKESVNVNRGQ
ncbi:mitotic-spindle organizing protein associated with a ring of gamma-tubulin 1 [Penicillium verhagenii]|nr:mitotic-spindle organizing protein associated with a ring of gamma-tubulin 1 [Penicillium verhagenii]